MRRSKRFKKSTQEPQFIDLDSDNEDKEMTTRLLLLTKVAQLKEWERYFKMAQHAFQYYKNEHKHFKKVKGGLALQNKMTKHYAKKNKLACAKLKEALMEIKI